MATCVVTKTIYVYIPDIQYNMLTLLLLLPGEHTKFAKIELRGKSIQNFDFSLVFWFYKTCEKESSYYNPLCSQAHIGRIKIGAPKTISS